MDDHSVGKERENGLFAAIVSVAAGLELGGTLRRIVKAAADLADAEYGALGVIGGEGRLVDFIQVGMDAALSESIGPHPTGKGFLGVITEETGPVRLERLADHPASVGFPPGHPQMKSFLRVPVRVRGEVFGNLYLTEKRGGGGFTPEDKRTVMALAADAVVENSRLYERSRQRERWQDAVAAISNAVLSGVESAEVLPVVGEQARAISGADASMADTRWSRSPRSRRVPRNAAFDEIDRGLLGRKLSDEDRSLWTLMSHARLAT